ncbi:carboxylesterase/lipase family protein [Nocardia aurea]|uniref:carboxylesterase/lipase family protein n=1 Tax=Nocardia aurea TaxID=2144174 RepID=UPI000D69DCB8|nr:carboxylesterase family protein [Nocardia aurea]
MEPIVTVTGGRVRGREVDGISAFLGVPYAAAAVGEKRFRRPEPVEPWDGTRDAGALGATCVQAPYPPAIEAILGTYTVPGAEYLNVNVWTPDPGGAGLPVMVWIHGGAFVHGSNAVPVYDGAAFARDGVVLVALNYRLGASGFAVLDGAPPNRGLWDQVAALAWVRENIRAFGGDPDNVTVFGESAGGMSVASLLASPAARGLFARAIMQSGNGGVVATLEDARLLGRALADKLGLPATAEAFAAVEPSALLAAQEAIAAEIGRVPDPARWGASVLARGSGIMSFFPTLDGELLTEEPAVAIAAGSARGVTLLAGCTAEEFRLFTVPTGLAAAITMDSLPFALARFGIDASVIGTYAANRPDATGGDLLAAIVTDAVFRGPTREIVLAQATTGTPAYLYEFAWRRAELGAIHALEVPFVFDTLAAGPRLTGPNPPQRLADEIHAAWIAFATTGDPGWPRYVDGGQVMVFDDPISGPVADPRPDERAVSASAATR